jgi:4-hydroxythreonine-4-phosphate dehydrogenase
MKTIIVTTGDNDGIGFEIFTKAILKNPIYKTLPVIFFISSLQRNSKEFKSIAHFCNSLGSLSLMNHPGLYFVESSDSCVDWVFTSARFCLRHPQDSILVTGPLDKNTIAKQYPNLLGHTEILASVSNIDRSHLLMLFIGKYFNVLCLTGHIPLSKVEKELDPDSILNKIDIFKRWIDKFNFTKTIGSTVMLGLNPHSGDKGLIGDFEIKVLLPLLSQLTFLASNKPLIPDAAFINFKSLDFKTAIALYHDQGLIPFKMAHGYSGVHVTVGLPFLRLSVDHGTAKELFGKGVADASSMQECLNLAYQYAIQ